MLAVSHIAWSPEEDEAAYDLLTEAGICQIEVAPARFFPGAVSEAMSPLVGRGMSVVGFQAVLFGKPDLQLFDENTRPALLEEMKRLAVLCSEAGGHYLVFGAPKNRLIPESMTPEEAFETAVEFFKSLGHCAASLGVVFGIEANPQEYGANFCTDVAGTAALVRAVDSPGLRWHFDTGELAMNKENLASVIADNVDLIASAHVSEPHLGAFFPAWSGHSEAATRLAEGGYSGPLSLEMKRPPNGLAGVAQAVDFMISTYGEVGR